MVEHDRRLAEFLARGLRAEHCAVDVVANGRAGLEYLQSRAFDPLSLDVALPNVSSTEMLHRIRTEQTSLPIIVMTARDASEDEARHLETGPDDYLTKQFYLAELVVRVNALLRRTAIELSDLIHYADVGLNRHTRQICRGVHIIDITFEEYVLLKYPLCSTSRVFSGAMILEHVLDQSFEGVTNTVDAYLRRFKRKVD
jgi:DNA-binding response OmpR family regulator